MIITSKKNIFDLKLRELLNYKDLTFILVKRDFVSFYKQTILGPIWFFIQPLLSSITYFVIFNKVAGISTDNTNPLLFYMSGILAWEYFANCVTLISGTFMNNSSIFSKVYFPRLIIPISIVISSLARFFVQSIMFAFIYTYLLIDEKVVLNIDIYKIILLAPLIFEMAILGLSIGLIVASLSIKYRDLKHLFNFGLQLLFYGSAVVYPISIAPIHYQKYILLNPMTSIISDFRHILIGTDSVGIEIRIQSTLIILFIFVVSLISFNIAERDYIDNI